MNELIRVPKVYLDILDQIFDIERKVELLSESNSLKRNIDRLKSIIQSISSDWELLYENPIGQEYNETRTDIDATVSGDIADNLVITEVIKPIIRYKQGNATVIARKGVVVVESKNKK